MTIKLLPSGTFSGLVLQRWLVKWNGSVIGRVAVGIVIVILAYVLLCKVHC